MLYPLTPEQTNELYNQAIARRTPEELSTVGVVDLGTLALGEALRNERDGKLDHLKRSELEAIADSEAKVAFETAIDDITTLYARIGKLVPTPEELVDQYDVNFAAMAVLWRTEKGLGHEPEIVLAPADLTVADAKALYQNLQDDATVNHDKRIQNGGLYIADSVAANWDIMTKPKPDELDWTLRIIPGTPTPTVVNISHDGKDKHGNQLSPPTHPTIPEYLTLQAMLLQADRSPIDDGIYYTWLNGEFSTKNSGAAAPHGGWNSGNGQVDVSWRDVGDRYDSLGSRSPVG